jgi:hypothetical protein
MHRFGSGSIVGRIPRCQGVYCLSHGLGSDMIHLRGGNILDDDLLGPKVNLIPVTGPTGYSYSSRCFIVPLMYPTILQFMNTTCFM